MKSVKILEYVEIKALTSPKTHTWNSSQKHFEDLGFSHEKSNFPVGKISYLCRLYTLLMIAGEWRDLHQLALR